MKTYLPILFLSLMSFHVQASSGSCAGLSQEIAAMKKANQEITASLVNNHETFASTLEEYSDSVSSAKGSSLNKKISKKMGASAQAFRTRGIQGKRMAQRYESASEDLLTRIEACLK